MEFFQIALLHLVWFRISFNHLHFRLNFRTCLINSKPYTNTICFQFTVKYSKILEYLEKQPIISSIIETATNRHIIYRRRLLSSDKNSSSHLMNLGQAILPLIVFHLSTITGRLRQNRISLCSLRDKST